MKPVFSISSNDEWDVKIAHNLRSNRVNYYNDLAVKGLNLEESWAMIINRAMVISGEGSELACESARAFGLDVDQIESHNITNTLAAEFRDSLVIGNIVIPLSHADMDQASWHHQVRLMNHRMEYAEVARVFDHMAVWHHIITRTRVPTIVLESRARLDESVPYHLPRNSVIGLDTGGELHQHNVNYRVMPGVWAYSIDQFAARKMFNRVLEQGIRDPLELMFRADQQLIVLGSCAHRV